MSYPYNDASPIAQWEGKIKERNDDTTPQVHIHTTRINQSVGGLCERPLHTGPI
jgi:hypothetical protein